MHDMYSIFTGFDMLIIFDVVRATFDISMLRRKKTSTEYEIETEIDRERESERKAMSTRVVCVPFALPSIFFLPRFVVTVAAKYILFQNKITVIIFVTLNARARVCVCGK